MARCCTAVPGTGVDYEKGCGRPGIRRSAGEKEEEMSTELIRREEDGTLSFGDYTLETKAKVNCAVFFVKALLGKMVEQGILRFQA